MRRSRAAGVLVVVAALASTLAPAPPAAAQTPTFEAVAVWQQMSDTSGWDVGYAFLGRPAESDASSALKWWTPSGSPSAVLSALPGDEINVSVAVRPGTAEAMAAWEREGEIWWSRLSDGVWSAPVSIGAGREPAVAIDRDGTALAVWAGIGGGLVSARWDGVTWWAPEDFGPSGRPASLVELTFLTQGRALTAFAAEHDGTQRVHAALWSGSGWIGGVPVPLTAEQTSGLPEHGSHAFTRIALAAEANGAAVVMWGGPVGETIFDRHRAAGVQGVRIARNGTVEPLRTSGGSVMVGAQGCHSPALAMTSSTDLIGVFASDGFFEHGRRLAGAHTATSLTYDTGYDDVRPAVAPLRDGVVAVASALPYPFDDDRTASVSWSIGTIRPAAPGLSPSATWTTPALIAAGAQARYPAVASVLGGTQNPLSVTTSGRAIGLRAGSATFADTETVSAGGAHLARISAGGIQITGVESSVEALPDGSAATSSVASMELPGRRPIRIHGIRSEARVSCSGGGTARTTIGSIQIGDEPPVEVDARSNGVIPAGAYTIRVSTQDLRPGRAAVDGVRITGPGVDVTIGRAEAAVHGCVGSGLAAGSLPHEH